MANGQSVAAPRDHHEQMIVTPERWKKIEGVFEQALELAPEQRADFVRRNCNGDDELRREVESLIQSHAKAGSFIDRRSAFFSANPLEDTAPALASGQLIGPYRLVREIGRGGMGAVYLAERADEQYQKRVAIKLIKRGMDSDAVLRHFQNERQILASLDHPNIARLFDAGTTADGLPYFVMEFVDGIAIDKYCGARELSIPDRLKLFREVCAAVSYAHQHTVVHRDIKPSNILVTADGVPKLLDFGIAKILQPNDGGVETMLTAAGMRPLTPHYASPEQLRGERLTTATDVYSLGAVLFEILTGKLPYRFPSQAPHDVGRVIVEQEPTRPSTAIAVSDGKSQIPNAKLLLGDLDNIVLMALRKEPARRYQSVDQFSEDVRRYLESRPVIARRDTAFYRATKFVQRNKTLTATAALVALSLLGGIVATTWQAHRANAEKARAERRFNDVRKLAHSVLFDYHDAIKNLPGATAVRERLVKDALTYLDSLSREAGGDPALQGELAAAYERVADVLGQPFAASLGDTAGATKSYLKALRIREALVAGSPQNRQNRRDLAQNYARISKQLIQTNEAARGMDYLRKALAIYLQLNAEQPINSELRYDLAATYNDFGFALEDWWGDASGALEYHRRALSLREQFVAADPGNQLHRYNLSMTYVNIGRALFQSGDTKGALASNQQGLAIRAALFAENPTNADYRRLLAISYQNDGKYRALLHDVSGALQSFRNKLLLDEQSLADDPVNAQTREDLGYSYERTADLLIESGDYLQALSHYSKALALYEEVSTVAPHIWRLRYRAIFARAGIANVQAKLGQRRTALAECSKVLALLNEIPENPASRLQSGARALIDIHLAWAYAALAGTKDVPTTEQQEHWHSARDMYARSLEIWQDMQKHGILTGEYTAKPEEVTREIAKCEAALGR
jgi:serine/threonine protein kinase